MVEKHPVSILSIGATGIHSDENIAPHLALTQTEDTELEQDWREIINIDDANSKYRDKLVHTLEQFVSMWDGTLGRVSVGKHRIEVKRGTTPCCQYPFRSNTTQRQLEKWKSTE